MRSDQFQQIKSLVMYHPRTRKWSSWRTIQMLGSKTSSTLKDYRARSRISQMEISKRRSRLRQARQTARRHPSSTNAHRCSGFKTTLAIFISTTSWGSLLMVKQTLILWLETSSKQLSTSQAVQTMRITKNQLPKTEIWLFRSTINSASGQYSKKNPRQATPRHQRATVTTTDRNECLRCLTTFSWCR